MTTSHINLEELAEKIDLWGRQLGFSQLGICDIDLSAHEDALLDWLSNNYHGNMDYMQRHGLKRARPAELEPGTCRVISVRLDYLPENAKFATTLKNKHQAYISRYALGRDYHKLMRKRLQRLGEKISNYCGDFNYRPLVDSAPVLERPLAEKAGLGWIGKHSLLINKQAGSWFFLGELFIDLPLPVTVPSVAPNTAPNTEQPSISLPNEQQSKEQHSHSNMADGCGNCVACIKICPTEAIVKPYVVDARRCISYFTIESADAIPVEFRKLMGNRIYGCDDCQLICPWNKYAKLGLESDFQPRLKLDQISLLELFKWKEDYFLKIFEGSAIRRIGYQSWQRNVAVALGNAPFNQEIINALTAQQADATELVAEHINWALTEQLLKKNSAAYAVQKEPKNRLIHVIEKNLPRDA